MNGGYIKLYRTMLDWEWIDKPITVAVYVYCLLNANYEVTKWHGIEVGPGQFVMSIDRMTKELGITRQNLRTAISHLKSTNNLTSKPTSRGILVTIENWERYQSASEQVTSKLTGLPTRNQPATNQQLTTYKEIEEREEESNRNVNLYTSNNYIDTSESYENISDNSRLEQQHKQFAEIKAALALHK